MKNFLRSLLFLLVFLAAQITLADPPGPPDPGGDPVNSGGVPVGGPVGSGIIILVGLCFIYAAYRIYKIRLQKIKEDMPE